MPVYINGLSLNDLFKKYDINLSELENVIDIKSNLNIPILDEKDYSTTLSNLSIEYTNHELIDDWIRDLLKFE